MMTIQLVGFTQDYVETIQSILSEAFSGINQFEIISCINNLLSIQDTNADVHIFNYDSCESELQECNAENFSDPIILFTRKDPFQIPDYLNSLNLHDVWAAADLNVLRIKYSLNHLKNKLDQVTRIKDLESQVQSQKQAEKGNDQLSTQQLEQIFNCSPCSVLIADVDGSIRYVNPEFCKVTGFQPEELKGKNPRIFKSGVHDRKFYKNMWDTLLSGKVWRGEICNLVKDGSKQWERVAMIPLKNSSGELERFIVVRVDDMARRQAEKALRQADTLKTVQELAGGIAHEFSQPLQVLTINAGLLHKNLPNGGELLLDRSEKMIRKISALVNNLKNLTNIRKKNYLNQAIIDLKASANDREDESAAKTRENGAEEYSAQD